MSLNIRQQQLSCFDEDINNEDQIFKSSDIMQEYMELKEKCDLVILKIKMRKEKKS
jgi:hypothetical protein